MKLFYFILLFSSILFSSCTKSKSDSETVEDIEPLKEVSFVFVGDLMTHPFLVNSVQEDNSTLMHLSNSLNKDISFANLEFTVNTNKEALPYPQFNGTYNYLKYFSTFFNTFSVANNHAYDQGPRSQTETMGFLSSFGDIAIGGSTNEKNIKPIITNINGVDIFMTAFSTLDNGLAKRYTTNKEGYSYYMNFYTNNDMLIKKVQSDLLNIAPHVLKIVSIHYGAEWVTNTRKSDKKLMRDMIESGVDIVVGHHPHVPREVEWYDGTNHSGVIIYSLGNFLANHKSKYPYIDIGATVLLRVNEKKEYQFDYYATYIYYFNTDKGRRARVIPIYEDPNIELPFTNLYKYRDVDINKMKDGYKVINNFFGDITNYKKGLTSSN